MTAHDLGKMAFEPLTYLVDTLVPVGGVVLLTGAPKAEKSMIAASVALGVAIGGKALGGLTTTEPYVLMLALDDTSPRRMRRRLDSLSGGEPLPASLSLCFNEIGKGKWAQDNLNGYLSRHPDTRLVVIDTLEHLRPRQVGQTNAYSADVEFLTTLREVCTAHPDVTLLVVHHTRKGEDADPITAVSGTHGLTGGADGVLNLTGRRGARRVLYCVSRDEDDNRLVLRWSRDGAGLLLEQGTDPDDPTVLMTEDDQKVYEAVVARGEPVTAKELERDLVGMPKIGNRLLALTRAGHLRRVGRGRYEP